MTALKKIKGKLKPLGLSSLAIALVLNFQGCSSPPLEPWHTAELDAEFTHSKSDEIQNLDDYQQLEDELFAQLQEQVYDEVDTGPEYALARYSRGSAADPEQNLPNWNRSFELIPATPIGGVLLLHGMSDSPYSLRALGESLHLQGYWVVGLRLPGHGTAPSGLTSVHWRDMVASVEMAMSHLNDKVAQKPIHIMGYSTGAPLAIKFALDAQLGSVTPKPASLILISPAIGVSSAAALASTKRRLSYIPGMRGFAWLQIQPEFDPYKYNSFPTNAGEQVYRLTRAVSRQLSSQDQSDPQNFLPPILVFKSTVDATVTTDAVVNRLLQQLQPERNELVLFDINRAAIKSTLIVDDPGPLTQRLMDDASLPFSLTLVSNETPETSALVARHKPAFSDTVTHTQVLDLAWPNGIISLSHVALPFPMDDPLYGERPPENNDAIFLGEMAIKGERGLLKLPASWLLRLRYNPFYDYLERRVLEWTDQTLPQEASH
jgi:alpha-beta hydrolase superfamily lysophospholipase